MYLNKPKMFRFTKDSDGDAMFVLFGIVYFTSYKGDVIVSWFGECK